MTAREPLLPSMPEAPAADPFEKKSWARRPAWWRLVECLMACTLFPVRLLVLMLVVVLVHLIVLPVAACAWCSRLCCQCCRIEAGNAKDASGGCDAAPPNVATTLLLQPLRWLCRLGLWALGFWRIRITRPPAAPSLVDAHNGQGPSLEARPVLVPNHTSVLDAACMFWLAAPVFVAKAEVTKMPLLAAMAHLTRAILVDRKDPESRAKVQDAIRRRALDSRFPPVCIFPEGTTTNGRALIQFKRGAFVPGAPVQPVAVSYGSSYLDVAAMPGKWKSFLLLMLQPYATLNIRLIPVHRPTALEREAPEVFAENVRRRLAEALQVPTTQHTYEDLFLRAFAKKRHICVSQNFEVKQLQELFELDFDGIKALLERFGEVDADRSGYLNEAEICRVVGVAADDPDVQGLFAFFDADGSGQVDFREFVRGVAMLSKGIQEGRERMEVAFALLDSDRDGYISRDALRRHLGAAAAESAGAIGDQVDFTRFTALCQQYGRLPSDVLGTAQGLVRGLREGGSIPSDA
eukprot:TRINITY_DN26950_c0_g1_i1.p1 TRINITY_DN26950_c0_g1~~TRINITY_DN26950_c0_g1_i1.p1  ORF type:complete len:520 (+),score=110.82 TRINITY_DN26950_c0_g1_i1:63-1622(+)